MQAISLFILALVAGSFLSVIVIRLPREEGFVFGRSECRTCRHRLGFLDLIPFFGWFFLRGRCRYCEHGISPLYPIMEWGAAGVYIWAYILLPPDFLWAGSVLGWILLALSAIDIRHYFLPDALTLILLLMGLGFNFLYFPDSLVDVLAGAVIGYVLFAGIAWLYRRIRGVDGLGLGDAKMLAVAGAWVGWQGLASVIMIGSISGLIAAVIWTGVKHKEMARYKVPFGPFLAAGLWLTWLYGPLI